MKKLLYISFFALLATFVSCTEDFNADVAAPQSWDQEELVSMPNLTVTPATGLDLGAVTDESVQLVTYSVNNMPEGSEMGDIVIQIAQALGEESTVIEHTNGKVSVEELQALLQGYYGKTAELRSIYVTLSASLNFDGQVSKLDDESFTMEIMPMEPVIVPEYYIVGGVQGWDISAKSLVFYPIDATAGTLSLTTNFSSYPDGSVGTPNFKIFSAENMGDWGNECYGAATDGDTSLSGALVVNGGAIQCPSNDIYTLNIDVLNDTYSMELAEDQNPTTYTAIGLIGAFNGWGSDAALTEVAPHCWRIVDFEHEAAGELKFRANNDWAISWGDAVNIEDQNYATLSENGSNITLPAGTFDVFFNDITCQVYFIEK